MENSNKTINRLKQYADYKGISLNKISIEIGVSNSYFSKMLKNNASIGSDILEKVLLKYEDLNPCWLLSGKGEMLPSEDNYKNNNPISVAKEKDVSYELLKEKEELVKSLRDQIYTQKKLINLLENQSSSKAHSA